MTITHVKFYFCLLKGNFKSNFTVITIITITIAVVSIIFPMEDFTQEPSPGILNLCIRHWLTENVDQCPPVN